MIYLKKPQPHSYKH